MSTETSTDSSTDSSTGLRKPREINEMVRYAIWAVFRRVPSATRAAAAPGSPAPAVEKLLSDWQELDQEWQSEDVVVRGLYDISGFSSEGVLLIWMHANEPEQLQRALRRIRRSALGSLIELHWSVVGMHRPAEFNKSHVPAFLSGHDPLDYLVIYPFNRSYEWYLLPDAERREILVEHGTMGRGYTGVLTNTVSAFALGDYEWVLALESDVLHDLVDLMRHLRGSKARLHVRDEIPFYTGRRVEPSEAMELLA